MSAKINKLVSTAKSALKFRNPTQSMKIATYSDQYQLIYYSVPKVACTTIKTCMAKLDNIETSDLGVHNKNPAIKRLTMKASNAACVCRLLPLFVCQKSMGSAVFMLQK